VFGRQELSNAILQNLESGLSVAIAGRAGIGKSALAGDVVRRWSRATGATVGQSAPKSPRYFWHTVRPGLNDQFGSVVHALGYFLHTQGSANTWRQLLADQSRIHTERMLGLIRYDLSAISNPRALICVDEADLLTPDREDHAQIIHLFEAVAPFAAVLIVGQRQTIQSDRSYEVTALPPESVKQMLIAEEVNLDDAQYDYLDKHVHGNLKLVYLFISLQRIIGDADAAARELSTAHSPEGLMWRIWIHLQPNERMLLMQLAVYRLAVPREAFGQFPAELAHLIRCHLIQADEMDGLFLPESVKAFVTSKTPPEVRMSLQALAIEMFEARGEYVEAMHHAVASGQHAYAVWLWLAHRQIEIERGHAYAALSVLQQIKPQDLAKPRDRSALFAARGQLLHLLGEFEAAASELGSVSPREDPLLLAFNRMYEASALEALGRLEQSLQRYRSALDSIFGDAAYQKSRLHVHVSYLLGQRMSDATSARREAIAAQIEANVYRGIAEERAGRYQEARRHYESALGFAEDVEGLLMERSRLYTYFGVLLWKIGELDSALIMLERASELHQQRGDQVAEAFTLINLTAVHILAGEHERAIEQAKRGLQIAERVANSFLMAGLASNAGEACYYANQLEEAEEFVMRSLSMEEEGWRPYALTVLGLIRSAQHKYAEAVGLLQQAIEGAKDVADFYAEAASYRALGDVHRNTASNAQAGDAYSASLTIYERLGLVKEINEVKQALTMVA